MKTGDIITPTHAIFKEGKLLVYTLPEESKKECKRSAHCCFVECEHTKYDAEVNYAREHPIIVHEKDKEKVKRLIWHNELKLKKTLLHLHDWKHTDLTEYKIDPVKMEVKWLLCEICSNEECSGSKQLACLIEDDKQ